MYKNLMHNKISHSIKCYSVADRHGFGKSVHHAQHDAQPTGNSENEKEEIVPFKKAKVPSGGGLCGPTKENRA